MGEYPDFLPIISEARWLGVAPWDVIGVPESAGMDVWVIWSQWTRELHAHAEHPAVKKRREAEKR